MSSITGSYFTYAFSIVAIVLALLFFLAVDSLIPPATAVTQLLIGNGILPIAAVSVAGVLSLLVYLGYRWYQPF